MRWLSGLWSSPAMRWLSGPIQLLSQIQVLEASTNTGKAATRMHKVQGVFEGTVSCTLGRQLGLITVGRVACGRGAASRVQDHVPFCFS